MKKGFLVLFSLIALIGIMNCVLLEPAFAYKDEAVHSESNEDSECCFIHCTTCHMWMTSQSSTSLYNASPAGDLIPGTLAFHHDSPAGSIFRPPITI